MQFYFLANVNKRNLIFQIVVNFLFLTKIFIMPFITQKELAGKLRISHSLLGYYIREGRVKTAEMFGKVLCDSEFKPQRKKRTTKKNIEKKAK